MNRNAQAVLLTALGAVALRIGITDEYTRYVNDWMKWPLVVSGALLVLLAFTRVLGRDGEPEVAPAAAPGEAGSAHAEVHEHRASIAVWALLIPIVVAFVIQPPALGAYVAERRVNEVRPGAKAAVAPLADGATTDMFLSEFVALASTYGDELRGHEVRLTGFVTSEDGRWYVTRLAISCCAADAAAFRVRVRGADAPPKEQWVRVVGTWVPGSGAEDDGSGTPTLDAKGIELIEPPARPYE